MRKRRRKRKEEEGSEEEEEGRGGRRSEVRVGWWKCRGSCGRELEMNGTTFIAIQTTGLDSVEVQSMQTWRRWLFRKGSKCAMGGCGKVLEENGDNFPLSKASKTGFSSDCKSCYDARHGKKDVPDVPDHQRCTGECGQVLKLSEENFARSKTNRFWISFQVQIVHQC